jgi:eukaryotic-like serine/threonine-protein kinase
VGHHDGTDFLVMEYLEGETLAKRLLKGPLAPDQVLRVAVEIADALDKAHRQGIVHRDLKPGNVMVTKSGIKLLDFGLAKLVAPVATGVTAVPTATDSLTSEGTILGTLPYMAPEPLEGKPGDERTEIFAFGAVLHEMATGQRAFEGDSQPSLIAAIMERDPPSITSLQPLAPPALNHVVRRCLAKDPEERWASAHDLLMELRWIRETATQPGSSPTAARPRDKRNRRDSPLLRAVLWPT